MSRAKSPSPGQALLMVAMAVPGPSKGKGRATIPTTATTQKTAHERQDDVLELDSLFQKDLTNFPERYGYNAWGRICSCNVMTLPSVTLLIEIDVPSGATSAATSATTAAATTTVNDDNPDDEDPEDIHPPENNKPVTLILFFSLSR